MRFAAPLGLSIVLGGSAAAAEVKLDVEIPQLNVAEYHRPYVAVWIQSADKKVKTNLAVWYDVNNEKNEGDKWLKDLRQWWRSLGRGAKLEADGLTGVTRPPGTHAVSMEGKEALWELAPGDYQLIVEAAREVGGREVVQIPFAWPPQGGSVLKAAGKNELGAVVLELKP